MHKLILYYKKCKFTKYYKVAPKKYSKSATSIFKKQKILNFWVHLQKQHKNLKFISKKRLFQIKLKKKTNFVALLELSLKYYFPSNI